MKALTEIVYVSTFIFAPVDGIGAGELRDAGDIHVPRVYDFGTMTEEEAKRLDGKRIMVRAQLEREFNSEVGIPWLCDGTSGIRWLMFRNTNDTPTQEQAKKDVILEGEYSFRPINSAMRDARVFQLDNAKIIRP